MALRYLAPDEPSADDLLTPDAPRRLRATGLLAEEIHVVFAALDLWLRTGAIARRPLARTLGIRESAVRPLVESVRRKLGVASARGSEPLVAALAERELLTEIALRRCVQRLARR